MSPSDENVFLRVGLLSVVAIFLGLFGREFLGETLSVALFFGGAIVGSLSVLYFAFIR